MKAVRHFFSSILRWFDSDFDVQDLLSGQDVNAKKIDWFRAVPFVFLHVACLGALWTGWSPVALAVCAALYFIRMFAITGIYHRYFSHKTYKTSRPFQFLMALLGATAVQRGALWWAAHHRHHHMYSDQPEDVHSPLQHGFLWSHMGWILNKRNFATQYKFIPELTKYPELMFLNRYDTIIPILFASAIFALGSVLGSRYPSLHTSGSQMLVWGFFISTTILFHATQTINSLSHLFGTQRYDSGDTSRNNPLLALLTMGEGWHNNHHFFQASTRQGFFWWEVDITFYILKMLSWTGLIWNLQPVPKHILNLTSPSDIHKNRPQPSLPV